MAELNTNILADLIAKRHHCLVKLRDLGLKQLELIAAGDMGPLLRLLSAKDQWIVAVQTIEKELAPYHDQDPEARVWASEEARSQWRQSGRPSASSCWTRSCTANEKMNSK